MVCLALYGCQQNRFWKNVQNKVNSGNKEVALKGVVEYDWDTVCILEPYSLDIGGKNARLKDYLPYQLGEFEALIPDLNADNRWAFVFVKDQNVISIEKKGRAMYLRADYSSNCLSKDVAKFKVDNDFLIITDKP